MYRPGGFPEYTPKEQKIFDDIQDIIRTIFVQRNFQHIWTPAVERNDILLKWWDTVSNEIFWLVWFKDYSNWMPVLLDYWNKEQDVSKKEGLIISDILDSYREDYYWYTRHDGTEVSWWKIPFLKDYSLHFDLTVPFARYTLDHLQELIFPFKRYQMQPVWRWERQQRGRYKEFRQCDVDSIWKSWSNLWYWYAVETISTLQSAIDEVFKSFSLDKSFVSHISHIWLTKLYLWSLLQDDWKVQSVVSLLDKFYKKEYSVFVWELIECVWQEYADNICNLIQTKDYSLLENYDTDSFDILHNTITILNKLWCNVVYDVTIVRWLWYYTDIVFETFIENEINLWSICSGWWYEDFTKFIDPKNVFSGIGGSIGLSRLMELILENETQVSNIENYMFLNFEDTFDSIISVYKKFLSEWKICELYPLEAKFGKQLEYADKKWIRYAVILGTTELERWEYQIKDLKSGEMRLESL